jgi:tetratricopeptide (TPR) repeat protein
VRNPRFIGREAQLDELGRRLRAEGIQVVVGEAGVGKTQLAIEYAHRHAERYRVISWLRAHRREAVTRFGRPLLRERGTLLVLDDATPGVVRECLPAGPGHVLVTSRESGWADLAGTMSLAPLDESEASAFLLRGGGQGNHRVARTLVSALGRLPLALELAARLTTARDQTLEEYLEDFTQRRSAAGLRRSGTDDGLVLVAACGMSYETAALRRPPATVVLDSAAFLDADHIPLSLLGAGRTGADLFPMLALLDQLGLIERLPGGFRIGRAVQEFVRTRLTPADQRARAQEVLATLAPALLSSSLDPTPAVEQLLPHALTLAEAYTSLQFAPEPTAQLWNIVGRLLQEGSDQGGARAAFTRSLAVLDEAFGPHHGSIVTVASNLATVLEDLGDPEGAGAAFRRALAVVERDGADPATAGTVLSNYGAFLQREGQHDEAASVMRRALQLLRQAREPSDPEIAAALNTLGLALGDAGDYEDAKGALRESVRLHEAAFGPRHPKVATVINNLGLVHYAAGEHDQARSSYERALGMDEAALGPDHPDVATDLNNLGLALHGLGDASGAQRTFERALRIVEAAYPAGDLRIAVITTNLGLAQHAGGNHLQAKASHERALRMTETALGPDHSGLRSHLNNLGAALQALDDHQGARAAVERAVRLAEAALGPVHPDVATALANLGHARYALGDRSGARSALRRSLGILRQFVTEDHPLVRTLRASLDVVEGRSDEGATPRRPQ